MKLSLAAGKSHGGFHSRGGWKCTRPIVRDAWQGGISLPVRGVSPLPSLTTTSWRERERERAKVAPGGGRPSRVMRVDRVEGATWEEAMPPLAPSDRSPTATPRLNCSSAIRLSKCHRELNFSLLPRTTFKSRFDKQIKWLVPWTTIIISLSDDDEIFL